MLTVPLRPPTTILALQKLVGAADAAVSRKP
jgi:hypothetical protein